VASRTPWRFLGAAAVAVPHGLNHVTESSAGEVPIEVARSDDLAPLSFRSRWPPTASHPSNGA